MWALIYVIFSTSSGGGAVAISNGEIENIQNREQCLSLGAGFSGDVDRISKKNGQKVQVAYRCFLKA